MIRHGRSASTERGHRPIPWRRDRATRDRAPPSRNSRRAAVNHDVLDARRRGDGLVGGLLHLHDLAARWSRRRDERLRLAILKREATAWAPYPRSTACRPRDPHDRERAIAASATSGGTPDAVASATPRRVKAFASDSPRARARGSQRPALAVVPSQMIAGLSPRRLDVLVDAVVAKFRSPPGTSGATDPARAVQHALVRASPADAEVAHDGVQYHSGSRCSAADSSSSRSGGAHEAPDARALDVFLRGRQTISRLPPRHGLPPDRGSVPEAAEGQRAGSTGAAYVTNSSADPDGDQAAADRSGARRRLRGVGAESGGASGARRREA